MRVFLQQAGRWLEFDEWPPAPARPVVLHLRAGGGLSRRSGGGRAPAEPVHATTRSTRRRRPAARCCSRPGKQVDNRAIEARPDVLIFTGPPLPADLDLVGPVRARVYVRPELEHADVFVRLCDVDPGGVSRNVVDGIRRLDPRTVPAPDVAVGADRVLAVDVELFPTAYRVRAGHRLRVQVSGGAFPRFARNLGTARAVRHRDHRPRRPVEVFHDAAHPSQLLLSVLR